MINLQNLGKSQHSKAIFPMEIHMFIGKTHWSYHFASSFPGGFTIRQVIPEDYIVSVNGNSTIDKMKEHLLQSLVSLADFADFKAMVLENLVGTWGFSAPIFSIRGDATIVAEVIQRLYHVISI